MFKIFDESPSRRSDYENTTEALTSDYPQKICSHFWVENDIGRRERYGSMAKDYNNY